MDSPFEVIPVDPDADDEEIERAYRERVKEAHPDQGGSTEEFQRLRAAYEQLKAGDYDLDAAQSVVEGDTESTESEEDRPSVEYLNYEAIEDHGWEITDDDLFEKAATADLDPEDYGRLSAPGDDYLLESAEDAGCTWPFSCRGGACANCAVAVVSGDLSMPGNHILPPEMLERGIRLSCVGTPTGDELQVVYNIKHLPGLDELRLPPGPFENVQASD